MLNFSFTSVLISILCCNVLIMFLSLVFRNHKILLNLGFHTLNVILLIIFVRLLFPFELPVTTNIYLPYHLSNLVAMILGDNYSLYGFSFSIWNIMIAIWIAGCIYKFYCYIQANKRLFHLIRLYGADVTEDEPYASILKKICNREHCKKEIHIIKNPISQEPAVYRFQTYYIVLPDNLDLNLNEIEYILSHEIFHIIHHDLFIKNLVQIGCILYWWNPFCILFQKQIDLLLELQADQKAGSKTKKDTINYLSCLVKVAGQIGDRQRQSNLAGISFTTESGILLNKRLTILMESDSRKKHTISQLVLLPVCILILCSLLFIFEPYAISPEDAEGTFELTKENCYAVETSDGTFNIYFNNDYWENTSSLNYYPNGMIVYYKNGDERRHKN